MEYEKRGIGNLDTLDKDEDISVFMAICQAPPGARCLFCGRDVTGSILRKCVYVPAPVPWRLNRIRFAGYGWVCEAYGKCTLFANTVFEKIPTGYGIVLVKED